MKKIILNNGVEMPPIVMSTNWMDYKEMKKVMMYGLQYGYRAIDTARDYGNEHIVGRVMQESIKELNLKREDIFVTTKIGNSQQATGNIAQQIEISLNNLRTDYIDLWLMHWPYPNHFIDTWHKMEEIYETGKVRAIGMANYRIRHFEQLLKAGVKINPHCVQFECHPLRTANELRDYCQKHNIAIQAYSPICRMIEPIKSSTILNELAIKYNKSIGQIILRWHIQQGTVPVFKSVKPERLKENITVFDFELTDEDMKQIYLLDEDYKYHIESSYCPEF